MPNAFKSGNTLSNGCIYKGQFTIGVSPNVEYGPSSTTSFWNGIEPPVGGYSIYQNKLSQGPSIRIANNDSECISILLGLGSTGSTISNVLDWASQQPNIMVSNIDYPGIVTSGMVLNLDAGYVSSYPTQGVSWRDLSINGYNGTLTNGPTFSSADGGSVVFDGSNDYVNCGNTPLTDFGTNNFTLSCWIFIPSDVIENTNYFKGLIVKKGAGAANEGFGLYYNTGFQKFLWSTANGSTPSEIFSTNTWGSLKNTWSNIVMVRENGVTNNGFFYINGNYESLSSSATILDVNNSFNLTVGASSTLFADYFFQGNIASGLIYNRALSSAEVLQNYNALKSRFGL